ncbi:MAG: hypothetical protein J7452_02315 [Thermoflexus sp.]|nr:hypothetical protein [Thermoflexus sp.]
MEQRLHDGHIRWVGSTHRRAHRRIGAIWHTQGSGKSLDSSRWKMIQLKEAITRHL